MKNSTAWIVHCILIRVSLLGCHLVPCNYPKSTVMNVFSLLFAKIKLRFYTKRGSWEWVWRNFEPISRLRVDVDPVGKYQAHVVHTTYSR